MAKKKEQTFEEFLEEAIVPENKQPYKLPDGWLWLMFDSVNLRTSGKTIEPKKFPNKTFELYSVPSFDDLFPEIINGFEIKSSKQIVNVGDVLLCKINPRINRVWSVSNFSDNPKIASGEWIIISTAPYCDGLYLQYYLSSPIFRDFFLENVSGVGGSLMRARPKDVANYPIPLPSLKEQKRIADKLDSMLGKIKEAREKIQEARETSATRRASILHKAFTGELTKHWQFVNNCKGNWKKTRFADFCLFQRGFDLPKNSRIDGKYPLVSSSGIIDCHNEAKTNEPVVIVGRSGSVGKVYYVDEPCWPLNTTLYSKNIFNNNPKFVYYFCLYFNFEQFSASTAVPTLNRNNFSDIMIDIPSLLEEQNEIVRILDKLLDFEEEAKKLSDLEEHLDLLEKSILNKAFRGELNTSDPSDESASELLKKIISEQSKEKVILHMDENFIKSISSPRRYKMRSLDEIEDKYIFGILTANGKMTPEDLWQKSQLNIDDFYYVLAKEMAEGLIKEIRINDNTEVLLEAL